MVIANIVLVWREKKKLVKQTLAQVSFDVFGRCYSTLQKEKKYCEPSGVGDWLEKDQKCFVIGLLAGNIFSKPCNWLIGWKKLKKAF